MQNTDDTAGVTSASSETSAQNPEERLTKRDILPMSKWRFSRADEVPRAMTDAARSYADED